MSGNGGDGKGLLAKAIARSLFPQFEDPRDVYFEVGSEKNLFDGYDGQPVIIWNDFRGQDLLSALGSRGDVFNVFDSHPGYQRRNKKYGTVMLTNQVNIVNSVQEPVDFVEALRQPGKKEKNLKGAKAEDPNQIYRRFPMFIFVDSEAYEAYISEGFSDPNSAYSDYVSLGRFKQNLRQAIASSGAETKIYHAIEGKTVKKIVDEYGKLKEVPARPIEPLDDGKMIGNAGGKLMGLPSGPDEKSKHQADNQTGKDDDFPF
jgi:hypothetical protein